MNKEKQKALDAAINSIEKEYGKGSVQRLSDQIKEKVPAISTGCISLDIALGVGGLPRGRIIEIYGPEAGGKTSVALKTISEAQKAGGAAAFIDAEHALDCTYAKLLGVNTDDLYIAQPNNGEEGLEIANRLIDSRALDIVVIDSVAALVPRAEIEGNMGDAQIALQARLMSQALRKLTGTISKSGTCVVFINQLRHKIGVMFGNPETTTGGNALKFYSSVRLEVRRGETYKIEDVPIGGQIKIKVAKNKVAPPFKRAIVDLYYDRGIDNDEAIIAIAVDNSIIEKAGAWYSYKEERIGQGKRNAAATLKQNPNIKEEILQTIKKIYALE